MNRVARNVLLLLAVVIFLPGCSTAPKSVAKRESLNADVMATITRFKVEDPSLSSFFDESLGYAVFPTVGKGGIGIGGAYGKGELFEHGVKVGYCDLSQATIGLQLGGQAYSEIIFFETTNAFNQFKSGNYAFSAQASAVAASVGASADVDYNKGVAVFTMAKGGLMAEASIGGQKFSFVPE